MEEHECVIVIEDDIVISPFFLRYMNDALRVYSEKREVFAVGAWTYFSSGAHEKPFFFRYPDSIAWATWRRSWVRFRKDGRAISAELSERGLTDRFNGFRNLPYFSRMLNAQVKGEVDSWAIRWTATAILENGLTVFPPVSMARHIGFSEDSTHEKTRDYNQQLVLASEPVVDFPEVVMESPKAVTAWKKFVMVNFIDSRSRKRKIINRIKEMLPFRLEGGR
jgi:hypothetical protein